MDETLAQAGRTICQFVEQGTHEQLLAQKGRYYNLYTMQWAAQDGTQPAKTFSEN